ncbi:MAG: DUF1559 domain-containing protein [Armatimonas sp.]
MRRITFHVASSELPQGFYAHRASGRYRDHRDSCCYPLPVFAQAREKARGASCLSNTKQINLAWQMYLQDYDETMVPMFNSLLLTAGVDQQWTAYMLYPYFKSWGMFVCPSQGHDNRGMSSPPVTRLRGGTTRCASRPTVTTS